jgi:hypothetical protein
MPTPTPQPRSALPHRGGRQPALFEGMERRERPGAARSMRSVRRALSAGTGPRSLIDPTCAPRNQAVNRPLVGAR